MQKSSCIVYYDFFWGLIFGYYLKCFYSSIYKGIDAINRCPDLELKLHRSLEELQNAADESASLRRDCLLNGCFLALDGWLCQIKVPGINETAYVSSYFSAHYLAYRENFQATCDAQSRFTYVLSYALVAPEIAEHIRLVSYAFIRCYMSIY